MKLERRSFLTGLAAVIAAPYVIRNSSILMPVRDRTLIFHYVYAINTSDPRFPVGTIYEVPQEFRRKGWLIYPDGREVSRKEHASLFSAIGTKFGKGDGSTTFNLPDIMHYSRHREFIL